MHYREPCKETVDNIADADRFVIEPQMKHAKAPFKIFGHVRPISIWSKDSMVGYISDEDGPLFFESKLAAVEFLQSFNVPIKSISMLDIA